MKSSLIRDLHKQAVTKNRGPLNDFLEPQQLALSKAGGCKLVHQVRMLSERRRDIIVVKLDMRNAHNEVSRALCYLLANSLHKFAPQLQGVRGNKLTG